MTARSRPPTDEQTEIHGAERRPRTPTKRGAGVEIGTPTTVTPPRPVRSIEIGTPTTVTPPRRERAASEGASPRMTTGERPASAEGASPRMTTGERSEPIVVISMKGPGDGAKAPAAAPEERAAPKPLQPRLRRLSEVSPQRRAATPSGGLGYLAPPRDPREARTRRWRDYVLWGSVVVMLAGAVMLGVWFLAGM
jgi:hypothetical protein